VSPRGRLRRHGGGRRGHGRHLSSGATVGTRRSRHRAFYRDVSALVARVPDTTGTPAPSLSFAIVIPMFNEETGAERCVVEMCRELGRLPYRSRLIVVDDGSSDGTAAILQRVGRAQPLLQVVTHPVNRGYGAALRTGVEVAQLVRNVSHVCKPAGSAGPRGARPGWLGAVVLLAP